MNNTYFCDNFLTLNIFGVVYHNLNCFFTWSLPRVAYHNLNCFYVVTPTCGIPQFKLFFTWSLPTCAFYIHQI